MYIRLKKRRNKIVDQAQVRSRQRSGQCNLPSILQKKDSEGQSINISKDFQRSRPYFLSNKKLEKNDCNYKNLSFSNLSPIQRSYCIASKLNLKINSVLNLNVSSKNWCLYDSNNKKYLGFREDYQRQIASLTKIMTTFLTLELISSLQLSIHCKVKISQNAASMVGTSANLQRNFWISLQDLLYGTMLPSGNDAAYTLAQYMGYLYVNSKKLSEEAVQIKDLESLDITNKNTVFYVQQFILQMNEKAKKMGLSSTRFSNPHGLQNAMNVSTAKDIISLSLVVSQNKKFKNIMNCVYWKYTLYETEKFHKKVTKNWWNTNKLLYKDWQGIKTGQTSAAGCCLASLKKSIYIVVLNSQNAETRFSDTQYIFEWYQKNYNKQYSLLDIEVGLKQTQRCKTQFDFTQTQETTNSF